MKFVITKCQEPGTEAYLVIEDPMPDQIREGFGMDEIWYGDQFVLSDESGNLLVAISDTGPYLYPHEPGEFLLYNRSNLHVKLNREQVILAFIEKLSITRL